MFIRIADNIIVNLETMVLAERTASVVKITCTNNDVVTLACPNVTEAEQAMDKIMEYTTTARLLEE